MTNALGLRQPRTLGQIISTALRLYAKPTLAIRLLVLSVPGVGLGLLAVWAVQNPFNDLSGLSTLCFWFVEGAFVGSSATYALDQWDKGQSVGVFQSLAKAWYHVPDLLAAAVIAVVIIAGLTITIVGIPWAVARYVRWAFTTQAIMIDGQEGEPSLAHSASVVEGAGWSTFWRLLTVELMVQIPLTIAVTAFNFFVGGLPAGLPGVFLTAIAFPFKTATRTLMFYDLKMRKALA